jgi:hypothetical protein
VGANPLPILAPSKGGEAATSTTSSPGGESSDEPWLKETAPRPVTEPNYATGFALLFMLHWPLCGPLA